MEEDHCAVFELLADNPFRRQLHAVAIEGQRLFEIVYRERKDFQPWFHVRLLI
ncbi:hypothetical protein D9M68_451280 [compost metagenome]